MKRISVLSIGLLLALAPNVRGQDAATDERLNKLAGRIEDLTADNQALRKQIENLAKQIDGLREQASKPTGNFANQEDVKRLADALKEVDQKRIDDAEKVRTELLNLRKNLLAAPATPKKMAVAQVPADSPHSDKPEKGFEYVVQKGDTLSTIVQAYRDKNIKVTTDQILKANPDLKPERMRVGQKIFIPAPTSS
jgi:LysM repeat protein